VWMSASISSTLALALPPSAPLMLPWLLHTHDTGEGGGSVRCECVQCECVHLGVCTMGVCTCAVCRAFQHALERARWRTRHTAHAHTLPWLLSAPGLVCSGWGVHKRCVWWHRGHSTLRVCACVCAVSCVAESRWGCVGAVVRVR
jgi:hypothetical protein